jgi:hypothetical protein
MNDDIRFTVPNVPGRLARNIRDLAEAGVNITGMGCDIRPGDSWGYVHLLVDDTKEAIRVLEANGNEILDVHKVDLIELEDRPGALADLLEEYSTSEDNIEVLYAATDNRIVIGTESQRRNWTGRRTLEARYGDSTPDP